jgi:DNA-binding transcriptional ArsR family regulator
VVDSAQPLGRGDRDLAPIAALFGDPARAAMLAALAGGQALPAGELARVARVHPATATAHLRRLIDGGLVRVRAQGRHRYHELAGPEVAAVLEALAQLSAPVPVRSLRQQRNTDALAEARTCYDHLAGRRGVQLRDRLLDANALQPVDGLDHALTEHGRQLLSELGIDPCPLLAGRRVLARSCLDWTQRKPHLAGALPSALTTELLSRGWLARGEGRVLHVAEDYDQQLDRWLGPTHQTTQG